MEKVVTFANIGNIAKTYFLPALLSPSILLLILLLILLSFLGIQRALHFRTFSLQGIPGPPPSFWTGNMGTLRSPGSSPLDALSTWGQKYGPIYGYFSGSRPILVISDLDLVQEILTKKKFRDRPPPIMKLDPIPQTLVGLRGEAWVRVRSALSPIFSPTCFKTWGGTRMTECVQVMGAILEEKLLSPGESADVDVDVDVDVWKLFQGLTCDVISRSALAMKTNSQHDNENDKFLQAVRGFLRNALNPGVLLALCFPFLAKVLEFGMRLGGGAVSHQMTKMIMTSVQGALEERRKQNEENEVDVLQLMLNSGKLSDPEILGNAWVFILGGFETTASALTFSTLLLAAHPDVQDRLGAELEAAFEEDAIPTYEEIQKLEYLDQVVSESLRLYPPVVTFICRHVDEDVTLGGILHLRRGWTLQIPVWQIHHDPLHWPEPENFKPERFSREEKVGDRHRHPMSYIPFGAGPRSCIGARFALMEVKMGLAHIFRKFRVHPPVPGWKPRLVIPTVTLVPGEEIRLRFSHRKKKNL